jgi:hypothetical protein
MSMLISSTGSITLFMYLFFNLLMKGYGKFQLETKLLRSFYSVGEGIAGHKINKKENDVRLSLAEMLSHRSDY